MPVIQERKGKSLHSVINEIVERVNDNTKRIRVLEQKSDSFVSRINSVEKEILSVSKENRKALSEYEARIKGIEARLSKIEGTIKEIVKRMKRLATTAKISELESLIEIYNPVKSSFVTKEEVERIVEDKLKESGG